MPLAAPVAAVADVLTIYGQGVQAVIRIAGGYADQDWAAPTPCSEWRAFDLAGHLRCVADDFNEYLDDAPASRLARLMATGAHHETISRKLARQNAAELAALPDVHPSAHIAAFGDSARRYQARVRPLLMLPHHSYRGRPITVAGMVAAAAVEWSVHAWDLAHAIGGDYQPEDGEAARACWLDGLPQREIALGGDPWLAVLDAAGRTQA